ncbi:ribosomal protein S8e-domain-containing protein [Mycena sanguinolenta]|nr:ribosomal protein S8e-domain-containing protein [Mycena sanguinolenta]
MTDGGHGGVALVVLERSDQTAPVLGIVWLRINSVFLPPILARIPQALLLLVVLPVSELFQGISYSSRQVFWDRCLAGLLPQEKRQFELGRQAANTKSRTPSRRKHIHTVCICDGSIKYRALCLESSDFSEVVTRKTSLIRYVYNASNNELVRTNTLVKSTIIQVDAMLFRQWYETHYAQPITKKGKAQTPGAATSTAAPTEPVRLSKHAQPNLDEKKKEFVAQFHVLHLMLVYAAEATIDLLLETQFAAGCLYASISKWLGQSGRADGHILEGKELELAITKRSTLFPVIEMIEFWDASSMYTKLKRILTAKGYEDVVLLLYYVKK